MTPAMIAACEAYFIQSAGAEFPVGTLPVYFSNQAVEASATTYARFWVIPSDEVLPVGLGLEARSRNVGIIQIDVYGPKDRGAGTTRSVVEKLKKYFHRKELPVGAEGYVIFKDAAMKDMGLDGEEHRYLVRIPYRYDFAQERA